MYMYIHKRLTEAWEIWSDAVTSGRHTRGSAWRDSGSSFLYYQTKGWRAEHEQGSVNTIHHSWHQEWFNTKWELLWSGTASHMLSTWCHRTWPDLPVPPHICILQMVKYGSGNGLGRRPIAPLEYRVREKTVDSLCVYSAGREGYPWASTDHWEWRFWGRRVIVLDLEKQKF